MKRQSVAVGSGPELIGCEQLSAGTIVVDGAVRVEVVELELLEELDPRLIASVTVTVAELLVLLERASGASGISG